VPDWLAALRCDVDAEVADAEREAANDAARRKDLAAELGRARRELADAERDLDPYRPMLDSAATAVRDSRQRWWTVNNRAMTTTGRKHRAAVRDSRQAAHELADAQGEQTRINEHVEPITTTIASAAARVRDLESSIRSTQILAGWDNPGERAHEPRDRSATLADWRAWATGRTLPDGRRLRKVSATLQAIDGHYAPACGALADQLHHWAQRHGLDLDPTPAADRPDPPLELSPDL
jgi:hypothetical protein